MPYTLTNLNAWYQAVQFRDANPQTAASLIQLLNAGIMTQESVWQYIEADSFVTQNVNPVIRMYQAAFNRIPDQAGQNFWVDNLAAGNITLLDMANDFANSQEFRDNYGDYNASSPVTASLLTAFYQNVLQRAPDAGGYQFWLNSGITVGTLLKYFTSAPEFAVSAEGAISRFQTAELKQNLPSGNTSLWHVNDPTPVPTPEPEPQPGPQPSPGPAPLTFTVTNSSGSLSFGGTAMGDVTFTIASDGTLTFTREGVTASTTLAVSTVAGAPFTIKQSADAHNLSVANATALTMMGGYDANGHTYSLLDTLTNLVAAGSLSVSYELSDTSGSLGALTVTQANVVEGANNDADYTYTIADTIDHANNLNFTTAFAQNRGVTLSGIAGDQAVTGSAYDDSISGGAGNDTLTGGAGIDTFNADTDTDTIADLEAGETLNVGVSAYTYVSLLDLTTATVNNNGTIYVIGTINSDSIAGSAGLDIIEAGDGNDVITGGAGNDQMYGENDADTISGGSGGDLLYGGSGNDTFIINAVSGVSSESMSSNEDKFYDFDRSVDKIQINLSGLTTFKASGPNYWQYVNTAGSSDNEYLWVSPTGQITSGTSDILLKFEAGARLELSQTTNNLMLLGGLVFNLTGTSGDNLIVGGVDADTITGGSGADTLTGGSGADTFVFATGDNDVSTGVTTVANFVNGTDTTLAFTGNFIAGDVVDVSWTGNGSGIDFSYTVVSGDAIPQVVAGVLAAYNASGVHGFVATTSGNTITLANTGAWGYTGSNTQTPTVGDQITDLAVGDKIDLTAIEALDGLSVVLNTSQQATSTVGAGITFTANYDVFVGTVSGVDYLFYETTAQGVTATDAGTMEYLEVNIVGTLANWTETEGLITTVA